MSELIATPVVKNKFWVVEDRGEKIATIQAREDGGFVYVHDEQREYFTSTRDLKQKLNIKFGSPVKKKKEDTSNVYGFPIKGRAYNQVFDLVRKLPVYTKLPKSRSCYCAGYYLINLNGTWTKSFCPKSITINRYQYYGPYVSAVELDKKLEELYE
jgi:hypothetical protein